MTAAFAAAWNLDLRILLLGLVVTVALYLAQPAMTVTRRLQVAALAALYGFCLLAVPFWLAKPAGVPRWLGAGVLIACGVFAPVVLEREASAWSKPVPPRAFATFAVLYAVGAGLFYRSLAAGLTYYGDSDYHTTSTLAVVDFFTRWPTLAPATIGLLLLGWFAVHGGRAVLVGGLLVFAVSGMLAAFAGSEQGHWYLRYPPLFYYLNAAASIPLYAWHNQDLAYVEGFYRLLSFVSVVGFSVIIAQTLHAHAWPLELLAGAVVLTIPTVAFYASLTYIELPMLVLMTLVLVWCERDLDAFVHEGTIGPAFGCLAVISFFKETAIVYVAVFAGVALWMLWHDLELSRRVRIRRAGTLLLLLFGPVMLFLGFRAANRPYEPRLSNLLVPQHYAVLALSWWEQFGLLAVVSPAAWFLLWRRGFRLWCTLNLALVSGHVIFFMVDRAVVHDWRFQGNELLGYSRFNLYVLPTMALLSARAGTMVRRRVLIGVSVAIIAISIALSPVRPTSADRGIFWGDYTSRAADIHAPYDDVYQWIASHPEYRRLLVVGRSYTYQDPFYFMKYRIHMARFDAPSTLVEEANALNRPEQYDLILFQDERFRPTRSPVANGQPIRIFETDSMRVLAYQP